MYFKKNSLCPLFLVCVFCIFHYIPNTSSGFQVCWHVIEIDVIGLSRYSVRASQEFHPMPVVYSHLTHTVFLFER